MLDDLHGCIDEINDLFHDNKADLTREKHELQIKIHEAEEVTKKRELVDKKMTAVKAMNEELEEKQKELAERENGLSLEDGRVRRKFEEAEDKENTLKNTERNLADR